VSVSSQSRGSLDGKVVVVTGAASGMGRSTALLCASRGAAVVAADLNEGGAATVASDIESAGGSALACGADLTVETDVQALVDAAVERFGTVHALHNNAYAVHPGAATDLVNTSLDAWDWTMRTCLTSQFLCCRAVLPHMLRQGSGSIINVSSGNGVSGSTTSAAYGAAKAGTIVLTKYIATQYGKRGIRCNTIVPGWTIETGWTPREEEFTEGQRRLFDRALEDVCMPRLAVPDDIAPLVAFLASDDARYVQAATIDVNGGLLAHMPGAAGRPSRESASRESGGTA
jgi:NAD(P)-dependent dehydrogenase (short-subunit alcohol dehydrogenase family)